MSSVTMVLAVEAGQRMDRKSGGEVDALDNSWEVSTFLSCQAWEWAHFIHVLMPVVCLLMVQKYLVPASPLINTARQILQHFFFFITGFPRLPRIQRGVVELPDLL
jgi:cytochrome c oxidase subunit 3